MRAVTPGTRIKFDSHDYAGNLAEARKMLLLVSIIAMENSAFHMEKRRENSNQNQWQLTIADMHFHDLYHFEKLFLLIFIFLEFLFDIDVGIY